MTPVRFGILGSGYMGRTHAEAVRLLGEKAQLTAVAGGRRAAGLAERFGISEAATAEALIDRADVDAVIVTTPHHLHAAATVRALERGKSVLVEKPLATTTEDCDRMLAAAAQSGTVLAVGYHQRFRTTNRAAYDLIQRGAIGRILTAQVSMPMQHTTAVSNFGSDWSWWNEPASVGHLINSMPHAIDLLRWGTGTDVTRVTALCRTLLPGLAVEDTTMALAEFSGGMIASFFSSRALPHATFPGEGFRLRMVGSDGLIDLDPYAELRVADASGWRTVAAQPPVGHESADTAFGMARMAAYRDQLQAFVVERDLRARSAHRPSSGPNAVGGQARPEVALHLGTGADGRAAVAACRAMLTASAEKRWVELTP